MRYAIIDAGNTQVFSTHQYTGSDWATFKTTYETENPTKLLVDLGLSVFPAGQGWSQEVNGTYPQAAKGILDVMPNIIRLISNKTDELLYDGTVMFKGEPFPRDHDTRDDVVLLAVSALSNVDLATTLLPLRVNAISTNEVTILDTTEAKDFALAMLNPLKAVYAGQADQIAAVKAMTTITQLITYIDPR